MSFEIKDAAGTLTALKWKGNGKAIDGKQTSEWDITVQLDAATCERAVENVFPQARLHEKAVAGSDTLNGGRWSTRTKMPTLLSLTVAYGVIPVVDLPNVQTLARPSLDTLKKEGDGPTQRFQFKVRALITDEQLLAIREHMNADVQVSSKAVQEDLSDVGGNDDGSDMSEDDAAEFAPTPRELSAEEKELAGDKPAKRKSPTRRGKDKPEVVKENVRRETQSLVVKSVNHKLHLAYYDDGVAWSVDMDSAPSLAGKEPSKGEAINAAASTLEDMANERSASSAG